MHLAISQKAIFTHPAFAQYALNHRVIAVLPFSVDLELENEPSESLRRQFLEIEGLATQQALATYFENKSNSKNLNVYFQPLALTQKRLQLAGLDYRSIGQKSSQELAKILEVDAIISGTLSLNVLLSNGIDDDFSWVDLWLLSPEFGKLALKISDGTSGKLLWRYEKAIDRSVGKNTKELIEKLMKQAARSFPYYKQSND
jgi:hypothetical protein